MRLAARSKRIEQEPITAARVDLAEVDTVRTQLAEERIVGSRDLFCNHDDGEPWLRERPLQESRY